METTTTVAHSASLRTDVKPYKSGKVRIIVTKDKKLDLETIDCRSKDIKNMIKNRMLAVRYVPASKVKDIIEKMKSKMTPEQQQKENSELIELKLLQNILQRTLPKISKSSTPEKPISVERLEKLVQTIKAA